MDFGSVIGSVGGSLASDALNIWSAHEAREANENFYRHRYRTMVADLKAAGLNPMLAYMKDAGTPPTTTPAHASGDLGMVINEARKSSAQSNLMRIQEANVEANTVKTQEEANKTRQETLNLVKMGKAIDAQAYRDTSQGALNDAVTATRNILRPGELQKLNSEAEAAELMLPYYRNLSEAEKTAFKREVAPFLKDAESISRTAATGAALLNISKIFSLLDGLTKKAPGKKSYLPRDWDK